MAFPLDRVVVLLGVCAVGLCAQDSAVLSGTVADPANTKLADAEVALAGERGEVGRRLTTHDGNFFFSGLPAGEYVLEVSKQGFDTLEMGRLRVHANERRSLQLEIRPAGGTPAVVPLTAEVQGISTDVAAAAAFEYAYTEGLQLEDRTPAALVSMAPGVTAVGESGKPAALGIPERSSYVTVDGASSAVRTGNEASGVAAFPPISLEALEEVQVQSSAIAPELGRTPGARVSLTSRSGTNLFHGSAYEYLSSDKLNANDWFANGAALPRGKMDGDNFGLTVGGPVVLDRTYFFASYEALRLLQPRTSYTAVPDAAARAAASAELRPFLNAFPLPNGAGITDGVAQLTAVVPDRSDSDIAGLRLDHRITDQLSLFASYRYATAEGDFRGLAGAAPNVTANPDYRNSSATAALAWTPSPRTTNEFLLNVGTASINSSTTMDDFGGAVPLADEQVFPAPITRANGSLVLAVGGAGGYSFGSQERARHQQIHARDTLSVIGGNHSLSFGVDFLRLAPTQYPQQYNVSAYFNGLSGGTGNLLSGVATNSVVSSGVDAVYPLHQHFSMYFQDSWRGTNRATFTWGFRWEVNPAPDVRRGAPPISQSSNGPTQVLPLYRTRWLDIAPRLGFAYQLDTTPGQEMIFRAGLGLFHDNGNSHYIDVFSAAPYVSQQVFTAPVFPLLAQDLEPPSLPVVQPFGRLNTTVTNLPTPEIYQWNLTLEKKLRWGGSLSGGYIRVRARDLPQIAINRFLLSPNDAALVDFDLLQIVFNGGRSDYHGLQMQFRQRLHRSLQTQISYAYGHSIDNDPYNKLLPGFGTLSEGILEAPVIDVRTGDSDFDIRHRASFSGSYNLPAPQSGIAGKLLGDWWTDWMITARTGKPIDLRAVTIFSSEQEEDDEPALGLYSQIRPHTTGEPVWLNDSRAPGGRRLNPGAFALPTDYEQGVLGRNSIHGFSQFQANLALRRRIAFTERLRLDVMAQAFNVLNNPSFADPSPEGTANLASPRFGISTDVLRQSTGMSGISQHRGSGSRSLQFALRLVF